MGGWNQGISRCCCWNLFRPRWCFSASKRAPGSLSSSTTGTVVVEPRFNTLIHPSAASFLVKAPGPIISATTVMPTARVGSDDPTDDGAGVNSNLSGVGL